MKTTAKHFEYFRERCLYYIDKLKITSWGVSILHGDAMKGCAASAQFNYRGAQAFIKLSDTWTHPITNEELDRTAKHEVTHLLTARLYLIGSSRFCNEDEIEQANEEVVEHLCKLLED